MTETTSNPGNSQIRMVPLTTSEWEIVDCYRKMADDRKEALMRFGYAMAAASGGLDYQRSPLEENELDQEQDDLETLKELRQLPADERASAIQALRDLLAKAEEEFVQSA
ncbi:hypothetical protein [Pseudomonas oryzihabitans]|uniref:hypothetical protein n=1 Tax=Pseudomonas oryzihabitans TaxID=47885 RepID=UPI00241F9EA2|nr:hypothetical protein [Pseudomonas oryzihabitans]